MEAPVFAEVDLVLFPGGGRSRLLPAIHPTRGGGVERAAGPGALPLAPSRGEGGLGRGVRVGCRAEGSPPPPSPLSGGGRDRGLAGGRSLFRWERLALTGPQVATLPPFHFPRLPD